MFSSSRVPVSARLSQLLFVLVDLLLMDINVTVTTGICSIWCLSVAYCSEAHLLYSTYQCFISSMCVFYFLRAN